MSENFDGKSYNVDDKNDENDDNDDDKDEDESKDEDADMEMGETDAGVDQLESEVY